MIIIILNLFFFNKTQLYLNFVKNYLVIVKPIERINIKSLWIKRFLIFCGFYYRRDILDFWLVEP